MEELLKRIIVDILEAVEDATEMKDPLCRIRPGIWQARSRHRDGEPVRHKPDGGDDHWTVVIPVLAVLLKFARTGAARSVLRRAKLSG